MYHTASYTLTSVHIHASTVYTGTQILHLEGTITHVGHREYKWTLPDSLVDG